MHLNTFQFILHANCDRYTIPNHVRVCVCECGEPTSTWLYAVSILRPKVHFMDKVLVRPPPFHPLSAPTIRRERTLYKCDSPLLVWLLTHCATRLIHSKASVKPIYTLKLDEVKCINVIGPIIWRNRTECIQPNSMPRLYAGYFGGALCRFVCVTRAWILLPRGVKVSRWSRPAGQRRLWCRLTQTRCQTQWIIVKIGMRYVPSLFVRLRL